MKRLPIIFGYEDIKTLYPDKDGFYSFLKRSLKNGSLKQIKKGLYALVDPSTGAIYASKFQIASHLFKDSYFSYHEALDFYGLATQSFVSRFTYLCSHRVRELDFGEVIYSSKKSVCGLEIIDRMKEFNVRVVSLERAIVDSIDNPSLAGGLDEVENALAFCPNLDLEKVKELLEYYDKATLYQKIGYLFEKYFVDIPESFFDYCLSKMSKKRIYFECHPGKTKLIAKWNLLIAKERELPDEIF